MADLSNTFANVNGTIYNKQSGQAYSNPQQFFQAAGVNSFNGINFDTAWKPNAAPQPQVTIQPAPTNQGVIVNPNQSQNPLPVVSSNGSGFGAPVNPSTAAAVSLQGGQSGQQLQPTSTPQQGGMGTAPINVGQQAPQLPQSGFNGSSTDLSNQYANVGGTIYNKTTGQAYSNPQDFFKDAGVSSFNGVKFDSNYLPPNANPSSNGGMYGAVSSLTGPVNLNAQTPDISSDSTSLTNDTSFSDISKMLSENLGNLDKLFSNLAQYSTVGSDEKAQQQKVASDQAAMTALGYQAQGLYNPDNQTIALPFLTGQAQNKMVSAGIQSTLDQSVLNYMQGNRQFAFNSASTLFDAGQKNLQTMLDVYTKAAPQNVSTNYNPTTGQLTAIMRNPLTGATYTGNLGNIGAQHQFTSTQVTTDPLTGALTFVGTTSDGQIVQQPLGGGQGASSVSNPLQGGAGAQGNFTPTGNPQVSNAGALLGNWVNGGTAPASSGYQDAVFQTVSKLTGQQITSATPATQLVSNIPALAQGIATAEGWNSPTSSQHTLNNPGNIIWANQPNATPQTVQTSSGPRTFAKFDTLQDGWNAMYNLLGKKLGAVPTPSTNPQDLQQAIKTLPSALQSAVHYLPDGTPFFNANQLTSAQIPMAQAAATHTGIPYINGDNASKLDSISVAQQNLQSLSQYAQSTLMGGGVLGKIGNIIQGSGLNSFFGSTVQTNFNTYRNLAISSLQGLVGGQGSGLRITAGEIATQIDNLPSSSDTPGQAATKAAALSSQLNKWIAQIIPGWNPPASQGTTTANGNTNYTQILNGLLAASQVVPH